MLRTMALLQASLSMYGIRQRGSISMRWSYMPDSTLLFLTQAIPRKLFSGWSSHPITSCKVQEILPVARHYPLLQFAALVSQVGIFTTEGKLRQLRLAVEQEARCQIN